MADENQSRKWKAKKTFAEVANVAEEFASLVRLAYEGQNTRRVQHVADTGAPIHPRIHSAPPA